jgi:hypothetical protein
MGSSALLILRAKSEMRAIDVQHELESWVCRRTHSRETAFAHRIKYDEDPGSCGEDGSPSPAWSLLDLLTCAEPVQETPAPDTTRVRACLEARGS